MKKFRRIMALLIASVMVMAMGVTAFAAGETYTITITAPENHTYEVFQVFKGTPENGQLTSLKYGKNARGTEDADVSSTDMEELATIAGTTYADDQAKIAAISKFVNFGSGAIKTITSGTASEALAPGYYVIRDIVTEDTPDDDGLTLYMFKVLNENLSISAKSDKPESEKKVKDINDTTSASYTDWQDSADHEIGDTIPYKLTFTLPDDYANFKKYYVNFIDELTAGLTYNGDAKIYYGDSDSTGDAIDFGSGLNLSYAIADLKTGTDEQKALKAGDVIRIEYTCYLNDKAVIGSKGNPNTYYVEFSRNPNESGSGKPDTGETPKDTNIVFTYKTIFNKVDEGNNALVGADFKLEKKMADGSWVDVTEIGTSANPRKIGTSAGSKFEFEGLDDGEYKLTETCTPKGYNPIEPITFTITANHVIIADNPTLTSLEGGDGSEFTMTPSVGAGSLTASVVNKSGAVLPTTGGVGTTMFYVVGAILVLGAGVVLVTRRRMTA